MKNCIHLKTLGFVFFFFFFYLLEIMKNIDLLEILLREALIQILKKEEQARNIGISLFKLVRQDTQ